VILIAFTFILQVYAQIRHLHQQLSLVPSRSLQIPQTTRHNPVLLTQSWNKVFRIREIQIPYNRWHPKLELKPTPSKSRPHATEEHDVLVPGVPSDIAGNQEELVGMLRATKISFSHRGSGQL
jgi:hypothetical protein